MLHVGITGGIGSGKSTVCDIFTKLGIPVYDSDSKAKGLVENELQDEIAKAFGKDIFIKGSLNKALLAERAFNSKENTIILNNIVHPAVGKDYINWRDQQKASFTLKEAALLIEAASYKTLDKLIVIIAPEDLRIERVLSRGGLKKDEILARMRNQINDSDRLKYADYVIDNSGKQSLIKQVLSIYNHLIELNDVKV